MKKILYTQRVEVIKRYNERRDCADQNIPQFIFKCGYLPFPMPNIPEIANEMIIQQKPDGIILTGGNSLVKYGGDAPEKDATDKSIIELALKLDIPLYGFCRGMQSIIDYYGIELVDIENHVAVRHNIKSREGIFEVNSFHNQGAQFIREPLIAVAFSEDGIVEEIAHLKKKVIGTMWHPERECPFRKNDIDRVRNLIG